jgi:hypothetical protein
LPGRLATSMRAGRGRRKYGWTDRMTQNDNLKVARLFVSLSKSDDIVTNRKYSHSVIPVQTGIQFIKHIL